MGEALGARIGDRVAEISARSRLAMLDKGTPIMVRAFMAAQESFFRLTGSEVRTTVGPLWRRIGEAPDAPEWLRKTGNFIADGRGQWATLLAGAGTGAVIGGGLGDLIANELAPMVHGIIRKDPNGVLTPADAAAIDARGIDTKVDLEEEAAQSGIGKTRYRAMLQLAHTPLAAEQIMELLRRDAITKDTARRLLRRGGLQHDEQELLFQLERVHPTPADAVAMWNRQIISTEEAVDTAGVWGINAEDTRKLLELGGEPPAIGDLMLAWQRGVIDERRFERGIYQGPLRFEWMDVVKQLRWRPLPPTEVADAVNQGHMSREDATRVAGESGIRPEDFAVIVDNAGIPPGPQEALDWLNRGLWTVADFRNAFLESRLKNKYIDLFLRSRIRLLPQETARSLLAQGFITQERCADILTQHGFAPEDVEGLIAEALDGKTDDVRKLTVSQMLTLYEDQEIDLATVTDFLAGEKFSEQDITWLIALADFSRVRRYRDAIVTRIRSGYVKGLLDVNATSNALDRVGVPPGRRDTLLQLWEQERLTVTKDLTTAQIVSAVKKGIMDYATGAARLVGQGYAEPDAEVILALAGQTPPE